MMDLKKNFQMNSVTKRIISIMAAVVMMVSVLTIAGSVVQADTTVTVKAHFRNTANWSEVYAYAWLDEDTRLLGDWPGTKLSENGDNSGYYTLQINGVDASKAFNYIFNNGSGGTGNQTGDLSIESSKLKSDADGVIEVWVKADSSVSYTAPSGWKASVISPEVNGGQVTFRYRSSSAKKVELFGSFNGWASSVELTKGSDGVYTTTMTLEPGAYEYKYVVDGNWITDPANGSYANGNSKLVVTGLLSSNTSGVKGSAIQLPKQLDYIDAGGNVTKKTVTYSLAAADSSVKLDNSAKTLTVPSGYAKEYIELVAAYGSEKTTVRVILMDEQSNKITVKLHYSRTDGKYTDWNVWMWEVNGKDGAQYDFKEENGEMVATFEVEKGDYISKVGFIVRKGTDWKVREGSSDRFVDLSKVTGGTVHCYVTSGNDAFRHDYGLSVTGFKVLSAAYDHTKMAIVVSVTNEISNAAKQFTVKDQSGKSYTISKATYSNGQYVLSGDSALASGKALGENFVLYYNGNPYAVSLPSVDSYSTDTFESTFTYTGNDLGATWTKGKTTFKVWAPTAQELSVKLFTSGNWGTEDLIKTVPMTEGDKGVWTAVVDGDLNGVYYTYLVTVGGYTHEVCDPYAKSTGVNGDRAMVLDMDSTDPVGWDSDVSPNKGMNNTDAIIYELHIRDLSSDSSSGIKNKGKFLGLTEYGTKTSSGQSTGLDHLIDLGITHLHLLPLQDYNSVDEYYANNSLYSWGYETKNFNVPEGSYSTNPFDGSVRVKEMKQMVKTLHDNGISVIMDVAYNHVYDGGSYCFNKLVPSYFSRISSSGEYSNGSGCGNDTATERSMVKKFIVDSVKYWADEYHIDGFRFDLVGLMDVVTINEIIVEVHKTHPDVIFYGEGWSLGTNVTKPNVSLATQGNSWQTPGMAFFSDTFRDVIKGNNDAYSQGWVTGNAGQEEPVSNVFKAISWWTNNPSQTVNFGSLHDNYTLIDKINLAASYASESERIKMNNLVAAIYMTSEGIPFIHAGEEFLRSKVDEWGNVVHNSYGSSDYVNSLKWSNLNKTSYQNVRDYYKGLIEFRKNHAALRLPTAGEVSANVQYKWITNEVVMMVINGRSNIADEVSDGIVVIFNATRGERSFNMYDYGVKRGSWKVCIDGDQAGIEVLSTVSNGQVSVDALSAMVLVLGETEDTDSVYTRNAKASVEKVTLNKTTVTLDPGKTADLNATISPSDASNVSVTWTSSNKNVATVDENGLVTAVGGGTATITASAGGKKATCKVTVTGEPVSTEDSTDGSGDNVDDGTENGTGNGSTEDETDVNDTENGNGSGDGDSTENGNGSGSNDNTENGNGSENGTGSGEGSDDPSGSGETETDENGEVIPGGNDDVSGDDKPGFNKAVLWTIPVMVLCVAAVVAVLLLRKKNQAGDQDTEEPSEESTEANTDQNAE